MKKTIAILLAFCLCVGLCACGGNSNPTEPTKSAEAKKADELILAIGQVSLDNEAAVLAAKAYYDTLTAEQKAQVENIAVLESAIQELDALKAEAEYEEIYAKALEYCENFLLDDACAELEKLPSDYKDVAERMDLIRPVVGLTGTWKCDHIYATTNTGKEISSIFDEIFISQVRYYDQKGYVLECTGLYHGSDVEQKLLISGLESLRFRNHETLIQMPEALENGGWVIGSYLTGIAYVGSFRMTYSVAADGKLLVTYKLSQIDGEKITAQFTYTKQ